MPIDLAIVGCGGMGHRHLFGLAELQSAGINPFRLVAACDPVNENATSLCAAAEAQLGRRPEAVASLEQLARQHPDLQAVDITTDPGHHHVLAIESLRRGLHVMVEKPMGLTVKASRLIHEEAAKRDRVLSVAENYRRDPMNRLAKALLDADAIGTPRLFLQQSIGGGDRMMITPWRHQKDRSGLLLDVGVHYADMMEYLLGPIASVYAQTRLHEPTRKNPMAARAADARRSATTEFYERWQVNFPKEFACTAEDAAYAVITFADGVVGHFMEDHAGHGASFWNRWVFGSSGSLSLPPDRSGKDIVLTREGQAVRGADLLAMVPDFHLDEPTARLFNGDRLLGYQFDSFAVVDRKIIAIEYAELGEAIQSGRLPEVGSLAGLRAVGVCYGILESGHCGRAVAIDDVLNGEIAEYQKGIDESVIGNR